MSSRQTPQETIDWAAAQLAGPRDDDWYGSKDLILMNRLCDALITRDMIVGHPDENTFALAMGDIVSTAGNVSIRGILDKEVFSPGTVVATFDKDRYNPLRPRIIAPVPGQIEPTPLRFSIKHPTATKYAGGISLYACSLTQIDSIPKTSLINRRTIPIMQVARNSYQATCVIEVAPTPLLIGEEAMHEYIEATSKSIVPDVNDRAHQTLSRTIEGLQAGLARVTYR